MKRIVLLVLLALIGCQGTPIGDAMIGKEKLAAMDDQYCQAIGAKKGTDVYVQCRMAKTAERDAGHQRAFARAGAGFAGAGASLRQNAYNNRTVNCTTSPQSTFVGGGPSSYRTSCY